MKIKDIFDFETMSVIWDNVWQIEEFKTLQTTNQSAKWHGEGVVSNHTKLVVDAVDKEIPLTETNKEFKVIMMISALFHDIGKGCTTVFSQTRNDWVSLNHAEEGERITRHILFDEDVRLREIICFFVRNHMKPLYILQNPNSTRDLISVSNDTIYSDYCNIENLILLKKCDCLGAIFEDDDWEAKLDFAKNLAEEDKCLKDKYHFTNGFSKWSYLNTTSDTEPKNHEETTYFDAYILLGNVGENYIFPEPKVEKLNAEETYGSLLEKTLGLCDKEISFAIDVNNIPTEYIEDYLYEIFFNKGRIVFIYTLKDKAFKFLSPNLSMKFFINNE